MSHRVTAARSRREVPRGRRGYAVPAATLLLSLAPVSKTMAQHPAGNPVLAAQDGFGLTVGLESTGIYSPWSIRGFNPQSAGNARIDGLYFDQQGALSSRVIEGSTVRVGISEMGHAFPAPTGVVDYALRPATDGRLTGTLIAQGGPFDNRTLSLDGSVPLYSNELQLPIGASFSTGAGGNYGVTSKVVSLGAVPQWTPSRRVTVRGFADWTDTTRARTMPIVFTSDDDLPPHAAHGFFGQDWALGHYVSENFGGLIDAGLSRRWSLSAGAFRSISNVPAGYTDLFVNTGPSGLSDHIVVSSHNQRTASNSGEAHLTGEVSRGQWGETVVLMARGRDTTAEYGGYDSVDLGPAYIRPSSQAPQPDFLYGEQTRQHTRLWSAGVAYQVQRAGGDLLAIGVQKEHYDAAVVTPGALQSGLSDGPSRVYGEVAVPLRGHAVLYSSYVQGFEDSGAAPSTAANSGAILATARTWQVDGGLRLAISPTLNLIAGLFELNKPYFNFDMENVDRQLGLQRASGLELSLAGELAAGLNINAGGLIGRVQIIGPDLAAQGVGGAAVGHPCDQEQVNAVYALPQLPGLSVDLAVAHFGSAPATVSDTIYVPQVTLVSLGERFQFRMLTVPATLRVQLQNAFNVYAWNVGYSPGFFQRPPRTLFAYLDLDLSDTSRESGRR